MIVVAGGQWLDRDLHLRLLKQDRAALRNSVRERQHHFNDHTRSLTSPADLAKIILAIETRSIQTVPMADEGGGYG
jgi:hypothetical protein